MAGFTPAIVPLPMRPAPLFPSLLLATLALLTACSRRDTSTSPSSTTSSPSFAASAAANTLHVSIGGEPSELDPHIINAPPDYHAIQAFFEGLAMNDPATLGPRPAVAERWDVSTDGLTYTFHLRANARWSNGDALTSADFLYSVRRALSPALGSQYTLLFNPVRGATDYAAGKLTDFNQVGFAAPDPRTLVVTLARPTPYFLSLVAGNAVWFPVHRATIERHGKIDQRGTAWTRPERIVSNGPFVLKEWRSNQKLVGEKSPTYWNAASVRLAAVHLHAIDSPDTEERAFRTGQLHVTRDIPITRFRAYRAEKSPLLHLTPLLTINFINVNTARPALADVRVRRALSLALDRTAYADRVQAGAVAPAFALIPPGLAGYRTPAPLTEDRAAAQRLLAEAGFPGGRGFPKFTLARPANASTEVFEAIQAGWRTVLGINVELVVAEPRTHWSNLQLKQFDLSYGGWAADYPDASTMLDLFAKDSGWNFTSWSDPRYDALLTDSGSDLHPPSRLAKLQQCEALLLDSLPVIPFSFPLRRILLQPTVRDWDRNALDRPDYAAAALAP